MRTIALYSGVLAVGFALFMLIMQQSSSPEKLILGEWKERSWEYERVDLPASGTVDKTIAEGLKEAIAGGLMIHQAERWQFYPNGELLLIGEKQIRRVQWKLKGRGHILQIRYDRDTTENYILAELNPGEMFLHFETDIQARGIAKLTFERLN